jgi:phage terminase small subunit
MQDGFLDRSERLLKIFHERSHIHDGLKHLSDQEVIQKVRESPTKLKKFASSFLKKLKKLNVTLTKMGEIDYSHVDNHHVLEILK